MSSIAFHTLGCKLNFAETSTIRRVAEDKGFKVVSWDVPADVFVINTCSVTGQTDKKCRNAIRRVHRLNPGAKVIVTGCFAELKPNDVAALEGVNLVIGNGEKARFAGFLDSVFSEDYTRDETKIQSTNEFFPAFSIGDRTRSFLKVQDGCNYFCSYCTIPFARGRSRNASIEELVKQAELIRSYGVKEIVLTGINIGDFGHSTGERFIDLLKALTHVKEIERYRISSIEPELLTSEILEFISDSRVFMPHIHIPLQSGSDEILKKMNRKYTTYFFQKKIEEIRDYLPDAGIGVDVITGFPSETDELFEETYSFISAMDISYLHVFSYSEREKAASFKFPGKINPTEVAARSDQLHKLSEQKRDVFFTKFQGKIVDVLMEGERNGNSMHGFTANYIKTVIAFDKKYINKIVPVRLLEYASESVCMRGELAND